MSRLLGYPAGIPGLILPVLQIVSEFNKRVPEYPQVFGYSRYSVVPVNSACTISLANLSRSTHSLTHSDKARAYHNEVH